jgi:L-asparaginase
MNTILVIDTGGTFNKIYDPVRGELVVDGTGGALKQIAKKWMTEFDVVNLIGKDSLEMTLQDRLEIMMYIDRSGAKKVLIVHGTDTMHVTAEYLAESTLNAAIVLTGAMVPFSIDPVEATANFVSAYTFLKHCERPGVHIAMHGEIAPWKTLRKDRKAGKFVLLT